MTSRCGAEVKVESKESIGRDPLRQLPGKWSSDMVCTRCGYQRQPGSFAQTVKNHTVLQMHLDGRSIGCFAHPYIEILALPRFEEEHVVAVVEFG